MAGHRGSTPEAHIAFDALAIEGGLLAADWLAKVAQLEAAGQSSDDYRVPKGLQLRDEIGRSWRIAQACFRDLDAGRASGADTNALTERFVQGLLRDALGFTSLTAAEPRVFGERIYPVPFFALGDRVPVVVAAGGAGLDTPLPEFGDGRRRRSAFGLLQEFLNASDGSFWGIASDGLALRLARDNASLTRPAWVEVDLGRIFGEALYPDFAALWLLVHESRFGRPGAPPEACPLEVWREAGREAGTVARGKLRVGFMEALELLGQGFVSHPENIGLRAALHAGRLHRDQYYGQLLRLVYRLIFLLTVEERNLLHPKHATPAARQLYAEGYALRRL
ncbi:MAG: type II DNA modification enzyme, partial [Candidatus Rokubacteria bacterium]|nr:type II DNA modification enzyme [Candidatus Rokubacteria bacterium]